jgi:glycosyltransferase involved in cell wall biosynthesis
MAGLEQKRTIAYIVKTWPRLSETFILNEVVSLEQRGVHIRIFSVKEADPGPAHAKVAEVRGEVTYLALPSHWRQALHANLRALGRQPRRYLSVLLEALARVIRRRHLAALRAFFKAGYLVDILFRRPADRLHAHFATAPALVAMFAHRLCGIAYTFTAHAKDIYLNDPDMFRRKIERAQAVVTCTEYNRRFLLKEYGALCSGKIHCIYHGIDISQFRFISRRPLDPGQLVILSVARLVEKKGLADLIAAADILLRRGRSFRVEIIGTGPCHGTLEAQVKRLKLGDHVKLLGAQAHDAVCRSYQRATVFVLPCVISSNGDRDGIPNVLLEAMASGLPVVSTPVSGIPELIESGVNGLLVPPHEPGSLAEAIEKLAASEDLREGLASAARAKLESSFSLEASAEQLLLVFDEVGKPELPCRNVNAAVAAQRAASSAEGS